MDTISLQRRSENMSRIRERDTVPEMTVRRLVHRMGFRYRLHVRKLPGRPDIVLTRLKKIIDVRGCFWHQHKGCIDSHIPKSRVTYWRPKLIKNKRRDAKNERQLEAQGWDVLIVWECETAQLEQLQLMLTAFLRRSKPSRDKSLRKPRKL